MNYSSKSIFAHLAGSLAFAAGPLMAASAGLSGIVAKADNAESAFASPAGMSRLHGTQISIDTMVVLSQTRFNVDESKTNVDGGNADLNNKPTIIPSFYYVRQLNDKWHAGVSFTIPSGIGTDYGSQWAGRYESVDFTLVYVALTPAVAYRFNDKLSFGAGIGINYTSTTNEVKIPQLPREADGKMTSDLDAIAYSVTLSTLYEFTPHTRAGIAWTSDTEADLEGNVRLRNLEPGFDEIATDLGIKNINVELTNTLPQRVLAGVYHEFDSGNYFTVDGMWMKFSDFSATNIKLNGTDVGVTSPRIFDDIYALTVGAGFPVSERLTYSIGALYVSQAVDDEDRSFSIRLDEMWGLGVGVEYKLTDERSVELDVNYINFGKAPVDTGDQGDQGPDPFRVAGESDDPYAILIDLSYHF